MRHVILIVLVIFLAPLPLQAAKKRLYLDGQFSIPLNGNDDRDVPRIYPVLLYTTPSVGGGPLAARIMIAGLYNSVRFSIDPERQADRHWNIFWEHRLLLIYAGDQPVIDGQSVNTQNFHANLFGNNAGAQYLFKLYKMDWRAGGRYDLDFYFPYGDTDPTQFIRPDFFFEQGPTLFIESRDIPPTELMTFGVYPIAKMEYRWRHDLAPWGPVGATSDVNQFFRISMHTPFGIPFHKRMVVTGRVFGGAVNKPDRFNTIKMGSMMVLGNNTTTLPVPGMYANEVAAEWTVGAAAGVRFILDRAAESKMAVFPFLHWASYNELLTGNTLRNNTVGGTGLHVMGRIHKKFLWDLGYGNVFGLYRQSDPAHEVYLHLLWVPWEKEVP